MYIYIYIHGKIQSLAIVILPAQHNLGISRYLMLRT